MLATTAWGEGPSPTPAGTGAARAGSRWTRPLRDRRHGTNPAQTPCHSDSGENMLNAQSVPGLDTRSTSSRVDLPSDQRGRGRRGWDRPTPPLTREPSPLPDFQAPSPQHGAQASLGPLRAGREGQSHRPPSHGVSELDVVLPRETHPPSCAACRAGSTPHEWSRVNDSFGSLTPISDAIATTTTWSSGWTEFCLHRGSSDESSGPRSFHESLRREPRDVDPSLVVTSGRSGL